MANGTIIGTGSPYTRLELDWTSTPIEGTNQSTVLAILYLRNLSGGSIYVAQRPGTTITIDGTTYSGTAPALNQGSAGRWELFRASKIVTHDADGNKSTSVSGYYPVQATLSGTYYGSFSVPNTAIALDLIEQAIMTIYDETGAPKRSKGVWIYDSSGVPRKAKGVWIYDSGGVPRKSK